MHTIIENIIIVSSFSYLVAYVVNFIEEKFKPKQVSEREKRLALLYGREVKEEN